VSELFAPLTVRPIDVSSHVWTFRPSVVSPHGHFAPH